jgi:steroid delta-isomerase-like uncharacterized protein
LEEAAMSIEKHKELVRRYSEQFWGGGDADAADKLFSPDLTDHAPAVPEQSPGPQGQREAFEAFHRAFPDLRVTTEDLVAEGDRVVLRWSARGTHRGELGGIPATGKQVTLKGIDILRIENGRIAERWAEYDNLGLMQQLGVAPTPEAATT